MYEVRIEGLRFRGFHGIFESERESGNEFVASVVASIQGSADETDRLADTADYAALASLLLEVSGSRSFHTVEGLTGAYVDAALKQFPMVARLTVRIDKLAPRMEARADSCGVTLERSR